MTLHPRRTLLVLAALGVVASSVEAQITSKEVKAIEEELKRTKLSLRAAVNASQTVYVESEDGEASYVHGRSRLFPLPKTEPVEVKDVGGDREKITIDIHSARFGKGRITLYPPLGHDLGRSLVRKMIDDAFVFPNEPASSADVIGNRASRVAHARGSNHLPANADRLEFPSVKDAQAANYTACSICFRKTPLISGYGLEKTLGAMVAAQFRQVNPVSTDDELNNRVARLGNSVLASWLVPLKGYNYDFKVVENEQPNAVACPAGQIFVTTGLMKAMESDEELEAVLAHEVAHVERRHGYRTYKRAQTSAVLGALVGAMVGGAVSSKTKSASKAQSAFELVSAVGSIAGSIAIMGYNRREESEADSYSLAYMRGKTSPTAGSAFTSALAKLKYSDTINGIHGLSTGLFMSHPEIDDRLSKARGADAAVFPEGTRFSGFDSKGNLVLVVSIDSQAYFDYLDLPSPKYASRSPKRVKECQIFCSIDGTAELKAPAQISWIELEVGGKALRFDNKEDTEVRPLDSSGMNFVSDKIAGLVKGEITGVKVPLSRITRWERGGASVEPDDESEESPGDEPIVPAENSSTTPQ